MRAGSKLKEEERRRTWERANELQPSSFGAVPEGGALSHRFWLSAGGTDWVYGWWREVRIKKRRRRSHAHSHPKALKDTPSPSCLVSGRMALCKRSGMSPSGTSGRCRWHSLAQGFYSAACQSPDRDARCQSFIRCQSQSVAGRDGSLPPWHKDWRKQCVEIRRDESGAEDARHPTDVSREEITGQRVILQQSICRISGGRPGQGSAFLGCTEGAAGEALQNLKVGAAPLKIHKDQTPLTLPVRPLSPLPSLLSPPTPAPTPSVPLCP